MINLEFRKDTARRGRRYHVLLDDERVGWIHFEGGVWAVILFGGHVTSTSFDLCKEFGSLETAKRKVTEFYQSTVEFPELIDA